MYVLCNCHLKWVFDGWECSKRNITIIIKRSLCLYISFFSVRVWCHQRFPSTCILLLFRVRTRNHFFYRFLAFILYRNQKNAFSNKQLSVSFCQRNRYIYTVPDSTKVQCEWNTLFSLFTLFTARRCWKLFRTNRCEASNHFRRFIVI